MRTWFITDMIIIALTGISFIYRSLKFYRKRNQHSLFSSESTLGIKIARRAISVSMNLNTVSPDSWQSNGPRLTNKKDD